MPTKEFIVSEIRRVAKNLGRAPGRVVFEKQTGIRMPEWYGIHWRSWGDALEEAGYQPNRKQQKLSSEEVLRKYAEAIRHFGRIPAEIDIRMYSRKRSDFPGHTTFGNHFGDKDRLLAAISEFIHANDDFADLRIIVPKTDNQSEANQGSSLTKEGLVYLLRSGDHYKIGRSEDLEKRVKQISVALPNAVTLEHSIRTDDPAGIEAYWHRRFGDRRANGEWFSLTKEDIRAFKRRKFQ
ncbi:MAG: GIY-YIG nuclease family protein [Nitratireductor sp.]|nr:GIY-YIG nuclease family protein [Nitratireductor sp.]